MLYATPQLLDQHIWVPVRDKFIQCCGHAGLTVRDGLVGDPDPPQAMRDAAEHGLPVGYRAWDPAGSTPGDWRDLAVQAGRPSALLRREALAAREASSHPPNQVVITLVFTFISPSSSDLTSLGSSTYESAVLLLGSG
jgi:hypothetical protein